MNWANYILGFLSAPAIVGLAAWFGKIWAGRILEKDRAKYKTSMETLLADVRTRDTKELLVHQLQFQKEFEIYKVLWKAGLELARAGSHLRMLQMGPPVPLERINEAIETSFARLRDVIFDNRPFYSDAVYSKAKEMLNGLDEVVHKRTQVERLEEGKMSDANVERTWQIETKLDEINALLEGLCHAIRERVWSTSYSGWDRLGGPALSGKG